MALPNRTHPQSLSLSTVLGLSVGNEIELALNMRAARGDLRAIGLLRQSRFQRQVLPIDLGRLETADDLVQAQSIILRAAARGEISAGDAKILGEQVEFLGQALERDQLTRKIRELSAKVGSTKEAAVNKQIKEQAALLESKVLSYLKREEQSWQEFTEKYGTSAIEVLIATHVLGFLYLLCGMEHLDFLQLGTDNHLPRAMQEIFDTCDEFARFKEPPASRTGAGPTFGKLAPRTAGSQAAGPARAETRPRCGSIATYAFLTASRFTATPAINWRVGVIGKNLIGLLKTVRRRGSSAPRLALSPNSSRRP